MTEGGEMNTADQPTATDDHPPLEEISGIFWFPVQAAKSVPDPPTPPPKPRRMGFEIFVDSICGCSRDDERKIA